MSILRINLYILLFISSNFMATNFLIAQDFLCEDDRKVNIDGNGKRYEGIRKYEDISIGRLRIISAQVDYKEETITNPNLYNLSFYLPDTINNLNILVEQINIGYYMMPIENNYKQGFHSFSWDCDFAQKNKVRLFDLTSLIKLPIQDDYIDGVIVPVVFYYEKLPKQVSKYRFSLISSCRAIMKFFITDESSENILFDKFIQDLAPNEKIDIFWNASNVKTGTYFIRVESKFLGEEISDWIKSIYKFYHVQTLTG